MARSVSLVHVFKNSSRRPVAVHWLIAPLAVTKAEDLPVLIGVRSAIFPPSGGFQGERKVIIQIGIARNRAELTLGAVCFFQRQDAVKPIAATGARLIKPLVNPVP